MPNKIDTRSATKKAKDAIYAALPVARIVKPLQCIKEQTSYIAHNSKGQPYTALSGEYWAAFEEARNGQGAYVQAMARQVLAA